MADQTLRPTEHVVTASALGFVVSPESAYDLDEATYAQLVGNNIMDAASIHVFGFPADSLVVDRDQVKVRVLIEEIAFPDENASATVWFRRNPSVTWKHLAQYFGGDIGHGWKELDVTGLAAETDSTLWQVAVTFARDYDPPDPE